MFSRLLHNFRREPPPILNPSICKRQPLNHVRTNQNVPLAAPSRSTRRPSRYGGDEPDRQLFAVGCRCVRTLTEAIGKEQRHADSDVVRVLLIALGIAGLMIPNVTFTETKKALDVGPLQVRAEEQHDIPIPGVAGIAAIVAGLGLIFASRRSAVRGK